MRIVRFYHRETGVIVNSLLTGSGENVVELNTPPGHIPLDVQPGVDIDPLSQRVAVERPTHPETGLHPIVDWQPAQPSVNHEWNASTKRWQLAAHVQQRLAKRQDALARIAALEQSQHRPHRELALDPTNAEAKSRLQSIEAQIAELRQDL